VPKRTDPFLSIGYHGSDVTFDSGPAGHTGQILIVRFDPFSARDQGSCASVQPTVEPGSRYEVSKLL